MRYPYMRRTIPVTALACAMLGLAAAPGHAADQVIAAVDRPTPISAYGGGLLFSVRDPSTGMYRLTYTEPLRPPAPLPGVPERSVPFDADLGPGLHGRFLAVYSRCDEEPSFDPLEGAGPPDYTTGRGCDLYQYDFTAKKEKMLRNASGPEGSEVLPSVWKDRIAFARVYIGTSRSYIYERARTAYGPSHRMPAGSPGTGKVRAHPTGVELYGRRLALSWVYSGSRGLSLASQIRLDDTRTKQVTTVDDNQGGGLTTIERSSPEFNSAKLFYARLCRADPGGCPGRAGLVRYRYSTGDLLTAPIGRYDLDIAVGNQSQDATTVYVLRDSAGFRACYDPEPGHRSDTPTCTIVATTPDYA
jgi:hypothetical protein